jgi:hypothetical protein
MEFSKFIERNPLGQQWGGFDEQALNEAAQFLPEEAMDFLKMYGKCTFHHDFLLTTLPQNWHESLTDWGLPPQKCHAFLRTAFGACVYFSRKKYYYLDPLVGRIVSLEDDPNLVFNMYLCMDAILDFGFYRDEWMKKENKAPLSFEQIHALVPALPFGGSFETSSFEVVQMREHLAFLAQLFGNKAKRI